MDELLNWSSNITPFHPFSRRIRVLHSAPSELPISANHLYMCVCIQMYLCMYACVRVCMYAVQHSLLSSTPLMPTTHLLPTHSHVHAHTQHNTTKQNRRTCCWTPLDSGVPAAHRPPRSASTSGVPLQRTGPPQAACTTEGLLRRTWEMLRSCRYRQVAHVIVRRGIGFERRSGRRLRVFWAYVCMYACTYLCMWLCMYVSMWVCTYCRDVRAESRANTCIHLIS